MAKLHSCISCKNISAEEKCPDCITLGEYTYNYRLKLLMKELEKLSKAADSYVKQLIDEGNCKLCLIPKEECNHE